MKYFFDQISIDTAKRALWVDKSIVPVRPKVFDLLVILAQSRGQALSKENLINKLWPNQAVCDGVLSACIREARKTLGDSGRAQRLIKTLHGYGFRLVAEVDSDPALPPDRAADHTPAIPPTPARQAERQTQSQRYPESPRSQQAPIDEQRQVTYLCCCTCTPNQKNLNEPNDTHALHKIDKAFITDLHQVASRYGGHVLESSGSETSTVFGLPYTQEDATLRAVLAAKTLTEHATHPICVGIDTGRVVAGFSTHSQRWHITQVDPVEQRAQDLLKQRDAQAIWLSDRAWQQVRDQVEAQPYPYFARTIYRVDSVRPHLLRPALRWDRLRTRFVGREHELAALLALVDTAHAGQGQLVGLLGEAGIGKTRLCQEFLSQLDPRSQPAMVVSCRSYGKDNPFGLVGDLLRSFCEIEVDDSVQYAGAKLQRTCKRCGIGDVEEQALWQLLGMAQAADRHGEAQHYFQHLSFALKRLLAHSLSRANILVIEDVHFIDSSSEASLQVLANALASLEMLLLLTYRSGYQPPFMGHSFASQIALNPLGDVPSNHLVEDILGPRCLDPDQKRALVERGQGNPLFLQELALQLTQVEPRSVALLNDSVPQTIQTVIRSRIDRLPPSAKTVLQKAAVIGKEFDGALLQNLVEQSQDDLYTDLNRLLDDELLHQTCWQPPRYAFRHGLTQQATYQSLLTRDRRRWHRQVATHLQQLDPLLAKQHPERLAVHYQNCEDWQSAYPLWTQAAKSALKRFAGAEALVHLQHAADCLQAMGPGLQQDERELELQTDRMIALQLTQGFGSAAVEKSQARIAALTKQLGVEKIEPAEVEMRIARGEFSKAADLACALRNQAEQEHDAAQLASALNLLGVSLNHMGRFSESKKIHMRAIDLYKKSYHKPEDMIDPGVSSYCFLALANSSMGFGDQARAATREALVLAKELNHTPSLGMAIFLCSVASGIMRMFALAHKQSAEAIEINERTQLVFWLNSAQLVHGWSRFHLGEQTQGLAEVERALHDWCKMHSRVILPLYHGIQAELLLAANQPQRALEHTQLGLVATEQDDQHLWEPELLRLRAEVLLALGSNAQQVDHWLQKAQESARELTTKLFELRIAITRVRLWRKSPRAQEMNQTLHDLLNSFTEGFDLPDLIQAKQLLQQVSVA